MRIQVSHSPLTALAALLLVVGVTAGCGSSKQVLGSNPHGQGTSIVLDHRIGPVSFAEPRARVTKTLGRGLVAQLPPIYPVRYYPLEGIYVAYTHPPAVYVNYRHPPKSKPPTAVLILTRSTRFRIHGVGVGSSLRQLENQVPVVCFSGTRYHPSSTGFHITYTSAPVTCEHGHPTTNLPVTVFKISPKTKRVTQITIRPNG
jgi:hypothetical protein